MKKLLSLVFTIISLAGFSQQSNLASGSGTTCSCQPNYTVCQASALFMSCCVCCQPGSSCGSWSAFGICGCGCESTGTFANITLYPNKYGEFMTYLEKNNISTVKLREYFSVVISGSPLFKGDTPQNDFIMITDYTRVRVFTDAYQNDLRNLVKNSEVSNLVNTFLNKK